LQVVDKNLLVVTKLFALLIKYLNGLHFYDNVQHRAAIQINSIFSLSTF